MRPTHPSTIIGDLIFTPRRTLVQVGEVSYFVKGYRGQDGYVQGDRVRARITQRSDSDKLSEVALTGLVTRSRETLLGRWTQSGKSYYLTVIAEQWSLRIKYTKIPPGYSVDDICEFSLDTEEKVMNLRKFASSTDYDIEERLILAMSRVRVEFSRAVTDAGEMLTSRKIQTTEWVERNELEKIFDIESLIWEVQRDTHIPLIRMVKINEQTRVDFSNWYTITIDGADARDLDDAISIAKYRDGGYLIAVHIADVAEYVREWTVLDTEAVTRGTSIYTPGRVIPMLPESLSNDLCSLHPGEPKLTLSAIMRVKPDGQVVHTEIVESVITSHHRGVYEEIEDMKRESDDQGKQWWKNIDTLLSRTVSNAYSLYEILKIRRKKEGKILFDSSEVYFDFGSEKNDIKTPYAIPTNVRKRVHLESHRLIEECMVLANEEVAKWCHTKRLPFLSRTHWVPAKESLETIAHLIGKKEIRKKLEPYHIRAFLDSIADPDELYRLSKLLLPRMAKASYSDTPFRHFGLALDFYSHFTSPIRRYPDLQIHRIIKEYIRSEMTDERLLHYKSLLKKIARTSSERERGAEDIERAFDSLYSSRYMSRHVGGVFRGQVSSMAEFAVFIELENGIEATLYLPRRRHIVNRIDGTLETESGKILYRIGERMSVRVERINMWERRIIVEKV
jgi:ribonuclease R